MNFQKKDLLIVVLYSIPYSFISIYGDFKMNSILGYIVGIAFCTILAYWSWNHNKKWIIALGNIISLIVSLLLTSNISYDVWGYYFKPATPTALLIIVSIISLIIQVVTVHLFKIREQKKTLQ